MTPNEVLSAIQTLPEIEVHKLFTCSKQAGELLLAIIKADSFDTQSIVTIIANMMSGNIKVRELRTFYKHITAFDKRQLNIRYTIIPPKGY